MTPAHDEGPLGSPPATVPPGTLSEAARVRTCYCGTTGPVVPGVFPHPDCDGSKAATPVEALAAGLDRFAAGLRRQAGSAVHMAIADGLRSRAAGYAISAAEVRERLAPAWAAQEAQLADCRSDVADAEAHLKRWPTCPDGCGCRLGAEEPDARECACDGPCTTECAENGYPGAPSYRDLAIKHVMDDLDATRLDVAEGNREIARAHAERDEARRELAGVRARFGSVTDSAVAAMMVPVAERGELRDQLDATRAVAAEILDWYWDASQDGDTQARVTAWRARAGLEPQ